MVGQVSEREPGPAVLIRNREEASHAINRYVAALIGESQKPGILLDKVGAVTLVRR